MSDIIEVSDSVRRRIETIPFNPEHVFCSGSNHSSEESKSDQDTYIGGDDMTDLCYMGEVPNPWSEESNPDSTDMSNRDEEEIDVQHIDGDEEEIDVHQEIINESMDEMTTSLCVLFIVCSMFTLLNVSGKDINEKVTSLRISAMSVTFMIMISLGHWSNTSKIMAIPMLWFMTSLIIH